MATKTLSFSTVLRICALLMLTVVGVQSIGRSDNLGSNVHPSASASPADASKRCWDNAMSQSAMDICASNDVRDADSELARIYQRALSRVRGNAVATRKIAAAQRAWVAYRDAYLNAMFPAEEKQNAYGTAYPMQVDELRMDLTRKQEGAMTCLALGSGHLYTGSTEGAYPGATAEESTRCNSWLHTNK